jgi:hypothetical protein
MNAVLGLMVYRLRMLYKEQDAVKHYGRLSSARSRVRFAARIIIQAGLAYNITFMVFTILRLVPVSTFGTKHIGLKEFKNNATEILGQSVHSIHSATISCNHSIWCGQFLQGIGILFNIMIIRGFARQDGQSAPSEQLPTTDSTPTPKLVSKLEEMEVVDIRIDHWHGEG